LYFLARNRVASAIPKIAALQRVATERELGCQSVMALRYYKDSKAAELLSPLLIDPNQYTRTNAALALGSMPATTWLSLPYIMLALREPDSEGTNLYVTRGLLCRIAPELGPLDDISYFRDHRISEVNDLYVWWSDIMQGKSAAGSSEYGNWISHVRKTSPNSSLLLFSPDKSERLHAVARLADGAAASNIPLFVLALRDPDQSVAYGAYKALCKLLPHVVASHSESEYAAQRDRLNAVADSWWRDELLGLHTSSHG